MIDLISFNKSIKIAWIKIHVDNSNNWKWKIISSNLDGNDTLSSEQASDPFLWEI